jgi:hypothetical protein
MKVILRIRHAISVQGDYITPPPIARAMLSGDTAEEEGLFWLERLNPLLSVALWEDAISGDMKLA